MTYISPTRAWPLPGLDNPRRTFSPKLIIGCTESGNPALSRQRATSYSATPARRERVAASTLSDVCMAANSNWAICAGGVEHPHPLCGVYQQGRRIDDILPATVRSRNRLTR